MTIKDWWKAAFETGTYPLIEATREPEWRYRTKAETGFLRRALGLRRGSRVLDLACGTGRHSIELARAGCGVAGVDISPAYLAEARRDARRRKARVEWLRRDMRALAFNGEFDAAVNLFTSFGYFPKAADDLRVLRGVRRALKPGGLFALEIINGAFVWDRMECCLRKGWPVTHWGQVSDGVLTLEDPHLLRRQHAMRTHWIFFHNGKRREMESFIRMYTKASLTRLMERAGLKVVRVLGGLDGAPFNPLRSRRMLLIARRPRGSGPVSAGGRRET